MIYVVYPVLLVVLLWGCSLKGRGEWNEEAFSLRQMKAIQGFVAICIMLHHIGQKTCASWLPKNNIIPGLEFFVPIGFVLVSFFTFCSGYGLYKSYKNKKDYLNKSFLLRRILPVIALGYIVALIFLPVRYLLGEKISGLGLLGYLSGLVLCNPNGWYVIVIPFFYLCFFLAFRFCKKEKTAILIVLLFTVAFQLLGTSLDHNDLWMRGEWWYNSIHLFVVGIFFAKHEEGIVSHLKKHYILYLLLGLILILPLSFLCSFLRDKVSYYGEYFNAPDRWGRRIICLLGEMAFSSSVVFTAFMIGLKLKVGNRFLAFMGRITLEFYLIHGLFVELFARKFDDKLKSLVFIKNNLLYVVVVFVLALPPAFLLAFLREKILGKHSPKKKKEAESES